MNAKEDKKKVLKVKGGDTGKKAKTKKVKFHKESQEIQQEKDAAVKIQKRYRGNKARKKLN